MSSAGVESGNAGGVGDGGACRCHWSGACATGPGSIASVKVLPAWRRLATESVPPSNSANRLLIASPSPVPPYLRLAALLAWAKG